MSNRIRAAVIGYGNIGRAVLKSLRRADDFEIAGLVRRKGGAPAEGVTTVDDIAALGKVDVALLCHPTRSVPELAAALAAMGIHTVDSYDIHTSIWEYVSAQQETCLRAGTVSVVAAGWDPGTDSALRALLEAMAPEGVTHTNFGPGMSMGHSVAARAVRGVKNAVSITLPEGRGVHARRVYVELEDGFMFDEVASAIKSDAYFAHDRTEVEQVEDVSAVINTSHGVLLEREGASGDVCGQKFSYDMRIDNPALTGQVMVGCARAATRLAPGCYTLPEIPPMALLPGSREELVRRLV